MCKIITIQLGCIIEEEDHFLETSPDFLPSLLSPLKPNMFEFSWIPTLHQNFSQLCMRMKLF